MNEEQKFELLGKLEKWSLIVMAILFIGELLYPFSILDLIIFYPLYVIVHRIFLVIKGKLQWVR